MEAFDPPKIDSSILKKARISVVQSITVEVHTTATPRNCLNNVTDYVKENGGTVQFGWIFSIIGNIALKMTAHAVVKKQNGKLLCITPNEYRKGSLKFACDNTISENTKDGFLPSKLVALIDDGIISNYLNVLQEIDELQFTTNGNADLNQKFNLLCIKRDSLLSSVLRLAKMNTGKNDYCFCGSTKINKKCCGKSL